MIHTRLAPCPCPHCGKVLDAATPADGVGAPSPGDATLCIDCGEWCVFNDELKLEKPSDDAYVEIGTDPECRKMRLAWLRMKANEPTRH